MHFRLLLKKLQLKRQSLFQKLKHKTLQNISAPAFRQDFDKYPALIDGMERVLCHRVHFKIIVFDLKTAYVGSANLTGAGLGMKGENTRNFEAGVLSSNKDFVKNAAEQFDSVWIRLRASANVNNFLSCKRA